jgi:uncharacterized membrane protein
MLAKSSTALFWFLCFAIALFSSRIFWLGHELAYPHLAQHFNIANVLWAHVLAASLALLLMPFQFWKGLRNRRPHIHRWVGRTYVLAVLLGGISALIMAPRAATGIIAASGFFTLGIAWLFTTGMALAKIRAKDIIGHKRWMIRSAALTFAAVTLRIYIPSSFALGFEFTTFYPIVAWACWVPNLISVELWQRSTAPRPTLAA